ncbi:nucleotide-binding protein [Candidatus Woesearchaeota archaeon]|nr:nucleotide-binding protein [Candidatus Woesearchaeota archaeon]
MNKTEEKKQTRGLYPKYSLLEALKIGESIKKNNNMHPYNRLDIASSINSSPNSSGFRLLIISSASYGLTTGSYIAEKLALTDLGSKIVSPTSDDEKNQCLKEALFNVPLFKQVFTKFDQGQLPRKDLLVNTLNREHKIPLDKCEEAYKIILKNAKELGILKNQKGTDYIRLDLLNKNTTISTEDIETNTESETEEDEPEEESEEPNPIKDSGLKIFKPTVFISHSKNKKIVKQIKQILEFGQFDSIIAEEKESAAIPISEKVFGLMKQCNCAIINLSVDGEKNEEFQINQNVLIEIGAAFLQYNKKVILLVDKRIADKLPSNLHGLYRCEYQGDELSFETAMKLQNALTDFRKE